MSETNITNTQLNILQYSALLNVKFKVYTYVTPEHDPGTLIIHPNLAAPFDNQKLFEMDKLVVNEISLRDILEKGFIKFGDTDVMEDMDIHYPQIPNSTYTENRIVGKHMYVSPLAVSAMIENVEFKVDEHIDFETDSDNSDDSENSMNRIESNGHKLSNTEPVKLFCEEFVDIDIDDELSESMEEVEPEVMDSALNDGKMDEIFDSIKSGEEGVMKNVDDILSEF
jgi:hypothetical protein